MRCPSLLLPALLVACAGSPFGVPVDLASDEAVPIVRGLRVVAAAPDARPIAERATDRASLRELCARVGGELTVDEVADVRFADEHVVVVVEPGRPRLERLVVASEEGVDVLTLVVEPDEIATGWQRTAFVLRLAQRPCQLAVVLRRSDGSGERTVAVFDGS